MEIPTKQVIKDLRAAASRGKGASTRTDAFRPTAETTLLDAITTIKAQALEIRELQAVIVRLREEISAMAESQPVDFWAKRRMTAWKALPEPRMPWEQFKRTWKDP